MDLEQSNQILRKIKKIFYQTSMVQCKGCQDKFRPVEFKGHVYNCRYLENMEDHTLWDRSSNQDQANTSQQSITRIDASRMVVKVSSVDSEGFVKFLLSYCGLSWYTQVKLDEV